MHGILSSLITTIIGSKLRWERLRADVRLIVSHWAHIKIKEMNLNLNFYSIKASYKTNVSMPNLIVVWSREGICYDCTVKWCATTYLIIVKNKQGLSRTSPSNNISEFNLIVVKNKQLLTLYKLMLDLLHGIWDFIWMQYILEK